VRSLVYLEQHAGELETGSLGVLSRAARLGEAVGVVLGEGARALAPAAGSFGASAVFACEAPALVAPLPQPRVDALETLVAQTGADTVLFGASVLAADVAAALAVRVGGGLNWDLVDLELREGELVGRRPALGDTVVVDVGWSGEPRLGLFRSGALEPVEAGGSAAVEEFEFAPSDFSRLATLTSQSVEFSEGPSIEEAEIIVAGGRGLGSPDGFSLLEELAAALGGAVAATRAVVDAGWYPYSTQVGQTGKSVSPRLYIACGISGAIQHKVGMQGSGTIVAINKDPNAPIFDFCDLGVVGDLHQVVPKLTELVRARS
jgi:electron transfer flavoprotein alpha subunit